MQENHGCVARHPREPDYAFLRPGNINEGFRGVSLQDPRFVKLGQQQLKLKDDAKIVEDSLYALASRWCRFSRSLPAS